LTLVAAAYTLRNTVMEQRKNQRFDLRLPFEIVDGATKTQSRGETRNVSSCGVLFMSKAPVAIGTSIEYLITLPRSPGTRSDVRLRCIGKVVRSEQPSRYAATLERYEFVRQKN
jgi:PilZ domain-containing protein